MQILVTGAAGFLGSNLVVHLLNLGYEVIGIDDLSTGKLENLSNLKSTKFEFINADVRECKLPKVDGIFNLACPASPVHYQFDPVKTLETNVLGTLNVLRHSKKHKIRLLQASTSEVYGDPQVTPQSEDYWGNVNPIGVRSCYDEGKRASETLCFDYLRQHSVDARVIRIFNTYGPKMAIGDGRVVSNFVVQALQNEDITIYGDGSQTRSFCFVDDLIDGISRVFFLEKNINSPINLGNPTEYSMLELASNVISLTQSKSNMIFKELPQDDPKRRRPDISLATRILDWEPKISLEEGLKQTISYFRKLI
jgi:UDP-glucuronate decarboxylase